MGTTRTAAPDSAWQAAPSDPAGGRTHLVVVALLTMNLALHGHQLGARGVATLLALASVLAAALSLWTRWGEGPAPVRLRPLVLGGVSLQLVLLGLATLDAIAPTLMARTMATAGWILIAAGAVGLAGWASAGEKVSGWLVVSGILVCGFAWLTGPVTIDVLTFQDVAATRMAEGQNPYVGPYPHPYSDEEVLEFWSPDRVGDGGTLQTGFPYPPASLLASSMSKWIFGDPRLAHLIAAVGAVWLLARARTAASRQAAALLASSPLLLLVVQQAWTEAFVIVGVVALVVVPAESRSARGWVMGLLAAVKQYAILLVGVHYWLLRRARIGPAGPSAIRTAVGVYVAVTLPFVLWGAQAFLDSVVGVHIAQRYRPDSLSLLAAVDRTIGISLEGWSMPLTALVVGLVALALARRPPVTRQGAAVGLAILFAAFLALARQAHVNYWMVVVAILAAAVGVSANPGTHAVGRDGATDTSSTRHATDRPGRHG